MIGFDKNLSGFHVDHIRGDIGPLEIVRGDLHLLHAGFLEFLVDTARDFAALRHHGFTALRHREGELVPHQSFGDLPEELLIFNRDVTATVKGVQNFSIGLEAERAQEHRSVEFTFSVDTDV